MAPPGRKKAISGLGNQAITNFFTRAGHAMTPAFARHFGGDDEVSVGEQSIARADVTREVRASLVNDSEKQLNQMIAELNKVLDDELDDEMLADEEGIDQLLDDLIVRSARDEGSGGQNSSY